MSTAKLFATTAVVAAMLFTASRADATSEICGNSIDDDGNGLTDDGCYPALTTGVCESPLSCGDTGMVSWSTGSLHYDLPPDVNPRVPYGPGIGFRRFYTSMYSPTGANPTTVNHTPLGPNWQHTYMTWLYKTGSGSGSTIVVHTSQGRDVNYTDAGACGSYECYTPQAGDHVLSLKFDATNNVYYLQLLRGETLKYNGSGQIIEIWDNLAPTPNKVLITWTSTSNGNVSTVTDASGERRLLFSYTNNLLTSVAFQLLISGIWTTQHTTTYDYTNGVTRDATSQWFVPQSSSEWTNLLVGTGIPNPTNMWLLQEASGNLADSIGTATLTASGLTSCRHYAQSVSGWTRHAVTLSDGTTCKWATSSTFCNPATTPCAFFVIAGLTANPSTSTGRDLFVMGDINGSRAYIGGTSSVFGHYEWNSNSGFFTPSIGTSVHPWIMSTIPSQSFAGVDIDGASFSPSWSSPTTTGTFTLGSVGAGNLTSGDEPAAYLYAAAWNNLSLTSTQQQVLENRIKNGPGLSQVTFSSGSTSQLAQQYVYDANGYLITINDGEVPAKQVISFAYSATVSGQLDLVSTSRGTVGFEYSSTRTGCTGNTALYFNQGNTLSCSSDSDCGTGFMCGGKIDNAKSGKCFLAGRCLTPSTVNGCGARRNRDCLRAA